MQQNTMNPKKSKITLIIEEELWDKFKRHLPRTISLNDGVVNLIRKEVENNEQ